MTLRNESHSGALAWLSSRLGPWPRFLLKRLASLVIVLAMLLVLTFLLIRLVPGDPAVRKADIDASAKQIEFERKALGLDQPTHIQFIRYIEGVARLDFGTSFITKQSVTEILQQRFPRTFQLAFAQLGFYLGLFATSLLILRVILDKSTETRGSHDIVLSASPSSAVEPAISLPPPLLQVRGLTARLPLSYALSLRSAGSS